MQMKVKYGPGRGICAYGPPPTGKQKEEGEEKKEEEEGEVSKSKSAIA